MRSGFFIKKLSKSFSYFHRARVEKYDRPVLYLHVGLPKTGTSAIQNFLFQNSKILQEQGVFYPDFVTHWSQHVPLAKAILTPIFPDAHFNSLIPAIDMSSWYKKLQDSCAQNKFSKVVVSSEFFWAAPAMQSGLEYHVPTTENFELIDRAVSAYKAAFSWFDTVKIVIYLRRQDHWLESFFNQQIKDGFSIPKEKELLQLKNYLLFSKNICIWEKYFGEKNILVRNFSMCHKDVVKDFCTALDIIKDDRIVFFPPGTQPTNPRLSTRAVKSMRLAIENKMNKEDLDLLGEVLRHTSSKVYQVGSSGVFSSQFHKQVFSAYEQDNTTLVERYPTCADFCKNEIFEPCELTMSDDYSPEEKVEILLERLMLNYVKENNL